MQHVAEKTFSFPKSHVLCTVSRRRTLSRRSCVSYNMRSVAESESPLVNARNRGRCSGGGVAVAERKSKTVTPPPNWRAGGVFRRRGAVYSIARQGAPCVFSRYGQPALPGGLPPARRRGKAGKRDAHTGKNPRVIKCCTSLTFARHGRTHGEALSRALFARARRRRRRRSSSCQSNRDISISLHLPREYITF